MTNRTIGEPLPGSTDSRLESRRYQLIADAVAIDPSGKCRWESKLVSTDP